MSNQMSRTSTGAAMLRSQDHRLERGKVVKIPSASPHHLHVSTRTDLIFTDHHCHAAVSNS